MSEPATGPDPAVGLVEFGSIATGIAAGDAMVKAAPVSAIYAGTVHPGKYLVLVNGDTASVDIALDVGRSTGGGALIDWVFLADIHPAVVGALTGARRGVRADGDALAIVETATAASALEAADAGVKAAAVRLSGIRLADGLGGKAYVLYTGNIGDVEAAGAAAADRIEPSGQLVALEIIPRLHEEMAANLRSDLTFMGRVVLRPVEGGVVS